MKPSTHLTVPSEALRRVFLPSSHEPCRRITPQPLHNRPLRSTLHPPQPRLQSTISPLRDTRPRDREIASRHIYLVQPNDQRLSDPQPLGTLLSTLPLDDRNRPTQYIQQVAPPTREHPYPVCRIVDKAAAQEAEEAVRRKEKEKAKVQDKRLEIGWSVSDNDLGHRMAKVKEWLGKGWRVEVVFGSRRKSGWGRKRAVSPEEAEELVEKIRRAVGEVEGAREKKGMEGEVGGEAVFFFEGKAKAKAKAGDGEGGGG